MGLLHPTEVESMGLSLSRVSNRSIAGIMLVPIGLVAVHLGAAIFVRADVIHVEGLVEAAGGKVVLMIVRH